jgi:DnaJ like chaperone protein
MVSPWITGALGWAFFGPLGGLLGYAAGSFLNSAARAAAQAQGGPPVGPGTARNDFLASLLALTAAMMKADGRATKAELDVVKEFLTQQFGHPLAQEALRMLRDLLPRDIPVGPVCGQIRANMNYSQRLALLHFLFSIAHADGELHPAEDRLLARLAAELGIHAADIRSIAAMFAPKADPATDYRVLELAPGATDAEIRKAYRRMSMKHHPDKVAHLGPEFQKTATEKFQRVNAAYARIKKSRGMA